MDLLGGYASGSEDSDNERPAAPGPAPPADDDAPAVSAPAPSGGGMFANLAVKLAALPETADERKAREKKEKKKAKKEKKEKERREKEAQDKLLEEAERQQALPPAPETLAKEAVAFKPVSITAAPELPSKKRERERGSLLDSAARVAALDPSVQEVQEEAAGARTLDPTEMYWAAKSEEQQGDKRRRLEGEMTSAKGALGSFSMYDSDRESDKEEEEHAPEPAPGPQPFAPEALPSGGNAYAAARARARAAAAASSSGYAEAPPVAQVAEDDSEGPSGHGFEGNEQFSKFAGRGNKKAQNIKIVDVHQDDLTFKTEHEIRMQQFDEKFESNEDVSIKAGFYNAKLGTTVVSTDPSKLHKRKHQINQLAHHAAANEKILQQQWATGARARQVARSRYGF